MSSNKDSEVASSDQIHILKAGVMTDAEDERQKTALLHGHKLKAHLDGDALHR